MTGKGKHAAFRVDASLKIGTGHVMRCLTLATALREIGWQCSFIMRAHEGHLTHIVEAYGFSVFNFENDTGGARHASSAREQEQYAGWLGVPWEKDAAQMSDILKQIRPDLLIVDHYALDARWEIAVGLPPENIIVIDDLANRNHQSGVLIDANVGRTDSDYYGLVPKNCVMLTGPQYAILRAEFAALHARYDEWEFPEQPKKIFIAMGGVDAPNTTCTVLETLISCPLPAACEIEIVMGSRAPWLDAVLAKAKQMPWKTSVAVNVDNVAERMAYSDIGIGAAGVTALERCCVGLPSIVIILADNQRAGAAALQQRGMALVIETVDDLPRQLPGEIAKLMNSDVRQKLARAARTLVDGRGVERIAEALRHRRG